MLESTPTDPPPADAMERAQRQGQSTPAPPMLDPAWRAGRKLTAAREQLGLSISEVADRIRVRREFLEALEDMNVKMLPGRAYALAFLRSYARTLGLDEKAIVEQFQDECALTREDAAQQIRNPKSKPQPKRPWLWPALVLLAAGAIIGWRALLQEQPQRAVGRSEQVASVTPQPPVQSASTAADAPARIVEIRALTAAWLEARGPDGTVFLSRVLNEGDVYRPDPSPGWTLHARDGGSFEVVINGQSAGLLGIAGSPVLGRKIDDIQPTVQAQNAAPRS